MLKQVSRARVVPGSVSPSMNAGGDIAAANSIVQTGQAIGKAGEAFGQPAVKMRDADRMEMLARWQSNIRQTKAEIDREAAIRRGR